MVGLAGSLEKASHRFIKHLPPGFVIFAGRDFFERSLPQR